jgi:hypothetical protein
LVVYSFMINYLFYYLLFFLLNSLKKKHYVFCGFLNFAIENTIIQILIISFYSLFDNALFWMLIIVYYLLISLPSNSTMLFWRIIIVQISYLYSSIINKFCLTNSSERFPIILFFMFSLYILLAFLLASIVVLTFWDYSIFLIISLLLVWKILV